MNKNKNGWTLDEMDDNWLKDLFEDYMDVRSKSYRIHLSQVL